VATLWDKIFRAIPDNKNPNSRSTSAFS